MMPFSRAISALTISLLALLISGGLWGPPAAQAQHPTAVTSIVNSAEDTTLEVNYNGSLLMPGNLVFDGTQKDSIPAEGAGTRLLWYPEKAAFRAGRVGRLSSKSDVWDADSIGRYSVAFGQDTRASYFATTAMGDGTIASGPGATAMGDETTASGTGATAMGGGTTAGGNFATAMGSGTTASGLAATAIGFRTTAATIRSVSIGKCNSANTSADNSLFVVGNGPVSSGSCDSFSDALVLTRSAELAIGHSSPVAGLHVEESVRETGATNFGRHVAAIENTKLEDGADILGLKSHVNDPSQFTNFISFLDADEQIGSIEGDNAGGINLTSSSADFAEELPVAAGAATPDPAEIVGVRSGEVRLETSGVDRVMIASESPLITGNATPATTSDDARRVEVAFIGQVPARVRGPVEVGDLIVPSGKNDGTALAVAPDEYRPSTHGPIAGQAWSNKSTDGVGEVTVAVGLGHSGTIAERLSKQHRRIDNLEEETTDIKAENEAIKERLAALEAERTSTLAGLGGAAGLLLFGLLLGGLLGAGLLWPRQDG